MSKVIHVRVDDTSHEQLVRAAGAEHRTLSSSCAATLIKSVSFPWYDLTDPAERIKWLPRLSSAEFEQLAALQKATWDGDLISKSARTSLLRSGLIVKFNGWQVVSHEGLAVLELSGKLKEKR